MLFYAVNVNIENIIIASKTHQVGKSGHPGNDRTTPAVVAPKRQCQSTTGSGRLSGGRVAVVAFVVDRGLDGGGRAEVSDGLPGVRRRGESVRRPVGRGGRRNQKEADVAFGFVRGQNEVRRRGRGHDAPAAAAASTRNTQQQLLVAPSARPERGRDGGGSVGRVGPDADRSTGFAAIADRRLDDSDGPTVRPARIAAESRTFACERFHGGTRSAPVAAGCRGFDAFRVLRRTGRVVDQLVGRRHGSRGRCSPVPAPRFFDEKTRGRLQQQEAPGRYIGKRSYGQRVVIAQAIGGGGAVKWRRAYGRARSQARSGGRRWQTARRCRF